MNRIYRPHPNVLFVGSSSPVTFLKEYDEVMNSIRPDELNMLDIFSHIEDADEQAH